MIRGVLRIHPQPFHERLLSDFSIRDEPSPNMVNILILWIGNPDSWPQSANRYAALLSIIGWKISGMRNTGLPLSAH